MYYLRARYYNPTIGRFIQEDIYRGDGLNLYAYVKNNPVMWIDPSGFLLSFVVFLISCFGLWITKNILIFRTWTYSIITSNTPKDRDEWKKAVDHFANTTGRGNKFNEKAVDEKWYPYNEVHLENGKRLDSYDLINREIVSRKATDLSSHKSISIFEGYLQEITEKYSVCTVIRSNKYSDIDVLELEGSYILEITDSNESISNINDYIDLAKKYKVEIRYRGEYNGIK